MNMLADRFRRWVWTLSVVTALSLPGTTTARAGMLSYAFDNINAPVPDNSALGLSDSRVVSAPSDAIAQVTITLKISGGYNGDLYAQVTHGSGFAVLLNRVGKTAADGDGYSDAGFTLTLSDSAAAGDVHTYRTTLFGNDSTSLGGPLTGTWAPDGRAADPDLVTNQDPRTALLSSFASLAPAGRWTLFISDNSAVGVSTLVSWELDITTVPEGDSRAFVLIGIGAVALSGAAGRLRRAGGWRRLSRWMTRGTGILATALVWMPVSGAAGSLAWEQPAQEVKLMPGDRSADVRFGFRNSGQDTVVIKTISTSCGCTTAQLEKKIYQPGGKGEITVHYTGDQRAGSQHKTVLVSTDDKSQPTTSLELRITHQMPLEVIPVLVYWRVGEPTDQKTVRLLAGDNPVHITSVVSSNPRINATVRALRDGKEYTVLIQPVDTAQKEVAQISVSTDYPLQAPLQYTIHARVVPAAQH